MQRLKYLDISVAELPGKFFFQPEIFGGNEKKCQLNAASSKKTHLTNEYILTNFADNLKKQKLFEKLARNQFASKFSRKAYKTEK